MDIDDSDEISRGLVVPIRVSYSLIAYIDRCCFRWPRNLKCSVLLLYLFIAFSSHLVRPNASAACRIICCSITIILTICSQLIAGQFDTIPTLYWLQGDEEAVRLYVRQVEAIRSALCCIGYGQAKLV